MKTYIHKVHYYETDQMGITHHSNYIRWMEEARVAFLEETGWGYERMETEGIFSPVIHIDCDYKKTTTFPDEIAIETVIEEYNGVRLKIQYTMKDRKTGEIRAEGRSAHCFLDREGKPVRMKKSFPELDRLLRERAEEKTDKQVRKEEDNTKNV